MSGLIDDLSRTVIDELDLGREAMYTAYLHEQMAADPHRPLRAPGVPPAVQPQRAHPGAHPRRDGARDAHRHHQRQRRHARGVGRAGDHAAPHRGDPAAVRPGADHALPVVQRRPPPVEPDRQRWRHPQLGRLRCRRLDRRAPVGAAATAQGCHRPRADPQRVPRPAREHGAAALPEPQPVRTGDQADPERLPDRVARPDGAAQPEEHGLVPAQDVGHPAPQPAPHDVEHRSSSTAPSSSPTS